MLRLSVLCEFFMTIVGLCYRQRGTSPFTCGASDLLQLGVMAHTKATVGARCKVPSNSTISDSIMRFGG